jgi:hypothetical protein
MSRRKCLAAIAAAASVSLWQKQSHGFGQTGTFHVRRLVGNKRRPDAARDGAAARWGWELMRRTNASARLDVCHVGADSPELLDEPFVIWSGPEAVGGLPAAERRGIERFLGLGGLLVVDDSNPSVGVFGRCARRELSGIAGENPISVLPAHHVLYKSFYMLAHAAGRVGQSGKVEAVSRGHLAQILFLDCDLLGALATREDGHWAFDMLADGARRREEAIRFAVNLAMYLLCSDYKDDQVHANWLMRRHSGNRK